MNMRDTKPAKEYRHKLADALNRIMREPEIKSFNISVNDYISMINLGCEDLFVTFSRRKKIGFMPSNQKV